MTKSSFYRSRQAFVAFASLSTLLFFLSISQTSAPGYITSPVKHFYANSFAQQPETATTAINPREALTVLYEDERISLLDNFDQAGSEALIKTAPGALDPDFTTYISRLEGFVDRYFSQSAYHPILTNTLSRMVNAQPPVDERDFRRYIFSFDKGGKEGAPYEFGWWNERLANEGWEIEVADDTVMEDWFAKASSADSRTRAEEDHASSGQARWEEVWHGLGRPVLKSDLLRYLMLLVKGGMYTDSDTSVLSDPNRWGTEAKDYTPRGLAALQRAMRHLDPDHPSSKHILQPNDQIDETDDIFGPNTHQINHQNNDEIDTDFQMEEEGRNPFYPRRFDGDKPAAELDGPREHVNQDQEELDFASTLLKDITKGINNPRVSVVVAVEYDLSHERQDVRTGYTRDLQIVQWTMMAKPFHPIYLDVLETATTQIMAHRDEPSSHDSWQKILDMTGPGTFTDAVLRYILVQYGVTPEELLGMEHGALVGDVLILPLHAFGAYLGGELEWNGGDASTRCVAHGFRGRWKGDMEFHRRSRVSRVSR